MLMVYDNKRGEHDSVMVKHRDYFEGVEGYGSNLEEAYANFQHDAKLHIKMLQEIYNKLDLDEYWVMDADGDIVGHYYVEWGMNHYGENEQ